MEMTEEFKEGVEGTGVIAREEVGCAVFNCSPPGAVFYTAPPWAVLSIGRWCSYCIVAPFPFPQPAKSRIRIGVRVPLRLCDHRRLSNLLFLDPCLVIHFRCEEAP